MKRKSGSDIDLRRLVAMIGTEVEVHVDRPLGSPHPDYPETVYQVNYGYIPGTKASDGDEIDAYIVGVAQPIERFCGVCIAVIHRLDDLENKLVVAPFSAPSLSNRQIKRTTDFQERYFHTRIVRATA